MSDHTGGPWEVSTYHGKVLTKTGRSAESDICTLPFFRDWKQGAPSGPHATWDLHMANARLIASSPELLEACGWVADLLDGSNVLILARRKDAIHKLRAAIRKAKGGVR